MWSARQKDKIIRYCIANGGFGNSNKISKKLGIEHSSVYALISEIADDEYLKVDISASLTGESYFLKITNKGKYFAKYRGYRWTYIKEVIIDFPKTFWFLIAIFTFWAGKDFRCSTQSKDSQRQDLILPKGAYIMRDTCYQK